MEILFIVVLFALLLAQWWVTGKRLDELEQEFARWKSDSVSVRELAEVMRRVQALEHPVAAAPQRQEPPVLPTQVIAPVVIPAVPPIPASYVHAVPATPVPMEPEFRPGTVAPVTLAARLRSLIGDQEWEALVGGSLLNKLGALILVIGIALFLGYSFAHVTAVVRASIALVVSAGILCAGVWTERLPRFKVFARGLIGAGWAALYATSYAIYALPAARVIQNPYLGSAGMLLVGIGMITHSLRYRIQTVTAVAYFSAFAALAVTPGGPFAVLSLIPLAASLLFLSTTFRWNSMALFGLTATYLTCISKGSSGAPLAETQALFLCYWVLFEGFDFLRIRSRDIRGGIEHLFPLNTIAFLGLSYQVWSHQAPQHLWLAAAMGAVLFLSSAITRAFLRPLSSFSEESSLAGRLREGSFEGAFLVSALLAGMAVAGRIPGVWTSFGLALEAEIIYLAGLRFRSGFLRETGARAFMVSLASLAAEGYPAFRFPVFGHPIWNWTPAAILHASLFYLNRSIRKPNAVFSSASAAIIALVIAREVPLGWVGTILILFGIVLLEIGARTHGFDLRVQSYALIAAGGALSAALQISGHESGWEPLAISLAATYALSLRRRWMDEKDFRVREATVLSFGLAVMIPAISLLLVWRAVPGDYLALAWSLLALLMFELGNRRMPAELRLTLLPLACAAGLATLGTHSADFAKHGGLSVTATYAGAWLAAWVAAARLTIRPATGTEFLEKTFVRDVTASLGSIAALCWMWLVVPDPLVTFALSLFAIVVFEAGLKLRAASLRWLAVGAMVAPCYRALGVDLSDAGHWFGISQRIVSLTLVAAALYWFWYRFSRLENARETQIARTCLWAAPVFVALLISAEAPREGIALGWVAMSLSLLLAGLRFRIRDLTLQGIQLAGLSFGAALVYDIEPPRMLICISMVAALYFAQWITRRSQESRASGFISAASTILLSTVLGSKVSGEILTVAWGLQGLALLGSGFPLGERILRLQGLVLLMVCILKLFLYDLRNLETAYRILSFIALGLILLLVSWIYSRYRDGLRRLL